VRWRVRWLDLAYGDQALFVRRDAFHALGGYREWPLMEDVDLIRRLRRIGRLYHSSLAAVTSARRWERDGWWRRSAQNVLLQALFFAGASPLRLANRYLPHADTRARREALVVMARAPSDIRGKSRLLRDIPGNHIELRRGILLDTLEVAARLRRADLFVAFEPADALSEFERLTAGAATLIAQCGDTLGDRMHNVFAHLFASGYASVVMIGSDLPTLPCSYIDQAFERLRDRHNAVAIGPATDGGYYLIGLRALSSELFASIPWSTPDVLASTLRAAKKLGLSVALTPEWYDVDGVNDLRRVIKEGAGAVRTREWAAQHAHLGDVPATPSVKP
jgi:rSAM/selenodomain-associated transferase 1